MNDIIVQAIELIEQELSTIKLKRSAFQADLRIISAKADMAKKNIRCLEMQLSSLTESLAALKTIHE